MWAVEKENCSWSSAAALGMRLGTGSGETEKRKSAVSLPGFLADVACGLTRGAC